jgi:AcrR family transcriptional regulator
LTIVNFGATPTGDGCYAAYMTVRRGAAADLDNRSRLLQAATDAFADVGYEGASLRAIADNAGVSFQLIAYYFGSKEELWLATVDYLFERYLETGKGLGFTASGNLLEQFRNHLRLLLTDMLQRPQLRKIWVQEYFADSPRYHHVIKPRIKQLCDTLALPYFREVVRLGIVERFTAEEVALLYAGIVQTNVVYPYYVELMLGLPAGSPKSLERQVDLLFAILTERLETAPPDVPRDVQQTAARPGAAASAPRDDTVVYAWAGSPESLAESSRVKQLEIENLHLKQLVGSLSLENKVLLERLGRSEQPSSGKDRGRDES